MRINRQLNLVIAVDTAAGEVHVHSTPISRETFERYYLVIAKTFAQMMTERLAVVSGPRVAALMLRQVAQETTVAGGTNAWDTPGGVRDGLMAEIRRLSNVIMPTADGGWQTMPFQEVVNRSLLDPDDVAEVESFLCFFTCASSMLRPQDLAATMDGLALLWGVQTTSSNCTEFAAGLPTSTEEEETTIAPIRTSSVPS